MSNAGDVGGLLGALDGAEVRFIIVGGVAATIHGSARLTFDLDVVYAREPDNLEKIVAALQPLKPYLRGAPPNLPFQWDVRTLTLGLNFTLTTTAGPIDLLGEITGAGGYAEIIQHSVETIVFGVTCRVIELEWLIRAKRAAGRPKDFEAIAELEKLLELVRGA